MVSKIIVPGRDPPGGRRVEDQKIVETLDLLKKVWTIFLIGLYLACFMNEKVFPGFRTEPLAGEEFFWKIQRVLFFALMTVGFLIDIAQTRVDRGMAFAFLFLSLVLGGLANYIGAMQFRAVSTFAELFSGG
ncbi:MAG: hypothetical protein HY579_04775 [Nitrospinae bacterium]|nr:hypothetical protein [Nitrospinota bacterium]